MNERPPVDFAIVGAGPAGLAAAYDATRRGYRCRVFERDGQVGGLSKTVNHGGFRCDIGGHRFFTKAADVERLWHEVLPEDFLRRPRLSRIYYRGRFFHYPLKPLNALAGLGPLTSLQVLASFMWRRVFPRRPEVSFEDWVSNRFGRRLYTIFFKTYTEKVWGIPCTELSADWAAQRIRNLDLGRVVLNALGIGRGRKVASLIDEFDYPRYGPGQMYEAMAAQAAGRGADIRLNQEVIRIRHRDRRITGLTVRHGGVEREEAAANLVSSMPISELAQRFDPPPAPEVLAAARALRYRSLITVNLIVRAPEVLPDTWVYLHAPEVRAGRIQMYKNWSPDMVPDRAMSIIGFEYFAWEGDALWTLSEDGLLDMARADLRTLNLVDPARVESGFAVRYPKAYPVYDSGYAERLAMIREYLGRFENLVCVGRYGQFRYNNMDHSIMTALLGVRRLLGETVDPWAVNAEAEYHEEKAKPD